MPLLSVVYDGHGLSYPAPCSLRVLHEVNGDGLSCSVPIDLDTQHHLGPARREHRPAFVPHQRQYVSDDPLNTKPALR